ncbi:MAG: hypothetical protein CMJ49_14830 [Planctomycetaceae bacterium]|nr:hypothetical protein [Planctomycetaceae bacterium]
MNGTQVDGVICHMFTVGDCTPYFDHDYQPGKAVLPEKTMSVLTWKGKHNLQAILDADQDYWALAVEAAHAQNKPFWGAMRFNDGHPGTYGVRSNFCIEHPEYRLNDRCAYHTHGPDPDGSTPCVHLDFSIPEVRAHQLKLVELLARRYDIDGFEWDFTRDAWHNFPANKKDRGIDITTAHMRDARDLLNQIG